MNPPNRPRAWPHFPTYYAQQHGRRISVSRGCLDHRPRPLSRVAALYPSQPTLIEAPRPSLLVGHTAAGPRLKAYQWP
eukprot:162642-Chlamydomonas_euryale.AAC.1